jgi:O-antigen/teichoic acid export membrane protein
VAFAQHRGAACSRRRRLSIPASASLRLNGTFATTIRCFALAYLPATCIRPFLLLVGVALLIAFGVISTASNVAFLLTVVFTGLALTQYALLRKDMPKGEAPTPPRRLLTIWRRDATPLILVALFTYFFADVAILMVTPLLSSADTAVIGVYLKLALLVGFAVQVASSGGAGPRRRAHSEGSRHDQGCCAVRARLPPCHHACRYGRRSLMGRIHPRDLRTRVTNAKLPLYRRRALVVLGLSNLVLAPLYGVLGAAIAVATLFWLIGCAIVLDRLSGLRTDAPYWPGVPFGAAYAATPS